MTIGVPHRFGRHYCIFESTDLGRELLRQDAVAATDTPVEHNTPPVEPRCSLTGRMHNQVLPPPTGIYGPHVYLLEASSADDICRRMGYAKAGSFRETTLHILGVSASAIKMTPFEVIKERSTRILVALECLKAGQKACTADKDGNIGTRDKGKNNFGNFNEGNNNIGSFNKGNLNWGLNNKGTNLRVPATSQDGVKATYSEVLSTIHSEEVTTASIASSCFSSSFSSPTVSDCYLSFPLSPTSSSPFPFSSLPSSSLVPLPLSSPLSSPSLSSPLSFPPLSSPPLSPSVPSSLSSPSLSSSSVSSSISSPVSSSPLPRSPFSSSSLPSFPFSSSLPSFATVSTSS
ncbi:hypothetical protein ACKKBG_A16190 [Auxenochlorella protothecoides x Auxenochlorella symbiontica]